MRWILVEHVMPLRIGHTMCHSAYGLAFLLQISNDDHVMSTKNHRWLRFRPETIAHEKRNSEPKIPDIRHRCCCLNCAAGRMRWRGKEKNKHRHEMSEICNMEFCMAFACAAAAAVAGTLSTPLIMIRKHILHTISSPRLDIHLTYSVSRLHSSVGCLANLLAVFVVVVVVGVLFYNWSRSFHAH